MEDGGPAPRRNGRSRREAPVDAEREEIGRGHADADEEQVELFRSEYLACAGRFIERTGVCIRAWYPVISHTSDFLIQVGKYAPSKDKAKGKCPAPLLRLATSCRGAGDGLSSVALCLKGASGLCHALSSGIKCLNHADGLRVGLDQASRPKKIIITSLPQLKKVLENRALTGSAVILDVGPQVTIALADQIDSYLERKGEEEHALIKDGPNLKLKLAQYARIMNLLRVHPIPDGLLEAIRVQERQSSPAPQRPPPPPPAPQQPSPPRALQRFQVRPKAGNAKQPAPRAAADDDRQAPPATQ